MLLIQFILEHAQAVEAVLVGLMFFTCAYGFVKGRP